MLQQADGRTQNKLEDLVIVSVMINRALVKKLDRATAETGQTRSSIFAELISKQFPEDELAEVAEELSKRLTDYSRSGRDQVSLKELNVPESDLQACLQQKRLVVPGFRVSWRNGVVHLSLDLRAETRRPKR